LTKLTTGIHLSQNTNAQLHPLGVCKFD